jgi:hypothetical protein
MAMLIVVMFGFVACKELKKAKIKESLSLDTTSSPYFDLNTGKELEVMRDTETGYVLNAETGAPVDIYINMNTMDTFYGRTNTVVNSAVQQNEFGYYELDESRIRWEDDSLIVKDMPEIVPATDSAVAIAP